MEDTIEVCSGCGKMPRPIDQGAGSFVCSRCGNRTTIQVTTENYEKVVLELDRRFHESILSQKAASISREPIVAKAKKKPVKTPAVKAKKPVKKKK